MTGHLKLVPPDLPPDEIIRQAALEAIEPFRAQLAEACRNAAREAPVSIDWERVSVAACAALDATTAWARAKAIVRDRIGREAFDQGGRHLVDAIDEALIALNGEIDSAAIHAREAEIAEILRLNELGVES